MWESLKTCSNYIQFFFLKYIFSVYTIFKKANVFAVAANKKLRSWLDAHICKKMNSTTPSLNGCVCVCFAVYIHFLFNILILQRGRAQYTLYMHFYIMRSIKHTLEFHAASNCSTLCLYTHILRYSLTCFFFLYICEPSSSLYLEVICVLKHV